MKVHVAIISHDHGTNSYVSKTKDGLQRQVFGYVDEWWDGEVTDEEQPKDQREAIDRYFELCPHEWLELSTAELED